MGFGQGTGFTATAAVVIVIGVARSSPAMTVSGNVRTPVSAAPAIALTPTVMVA